MGSWWLSSHWSGNRMVNGLQHTNLALTWSDRQSDRPNPINWLVPTFPSSYIFAFFPTILFNLLYWNNSKAFILYVLEGRVGAEGQLCCEQKHFWPLLNCRVLKPKFCRGWRLRSWYEYTGCASPVSAKANGFPLDSFPSQVGLHGGAGPAKIKTSFNKKN